MKINKFQVDGKPFLMIDDFLPSEVVDEIENTLKSINDWDHADNIFDFNTIVKDKTAILQGDQYRLRTGVLAELAESTLDRILEILEIEFGCKYDKSELRKINEWEYAFRFNTSYYEKVNDEMLFHYDSKGVTFMYMPCEQHDDGTYFFADGDRDKHVYTLKHKRGSVAIFNASDIMHCSAKPSPLDDYRYTMVWQFVFPSHLKPIREVIA
ncbi:hypothetical protein VH12019_00091 [Vibrio phage VH1_2019]|uniref:Uncharacterized protein n=1 Tax=Vibrio phage VH1_2019 TaxID=2686307 RepID=A0A6B9SVT9_9CAUD|nr:hypothetical protein VH12019_00091 [Vibrio phage VH1_2019]